MIDSIELATVRLGNAEGVSYENCQRHPLVQEIALALTLIYLGKLATQIFKKLDRRFPHSDGRLDRYWLEDEASVQHSVLGVFLNLIGDGVVSFVVF